MPKSLRAKEGAVEKGKLFSIYGFVLGYSLHQLNPRVLCIIPPVTPPLQQQQLLRKRLMGIEEYPSRPLQVSLKKQFEEGEKTLSSQYLGNQLLRQSKSSQKM
ncbi:hypothetical protein D8674_025160 [Pyrus ussuriensis x Pyrus communis]|uniref:Uncharacterized protein n=1 Tax=Pyrus ussuriensis x Pyrus communis TaxID=2448454 RepID=A0A5N5H5W0_9ROSA|nr:hypothetical protein D8674_025160 [Pyrus ussuriensis x Pyrus communis]